MMLALGDFAGCVACNTTDVELYRAASHRRVDRNDNVQINQAGGGTRKLTFEK